MSKLQIHTAYKAMTSSQAIQLKFGDVKTKIDNLKLTSEQAKEVNSQIEKLYQHARTLTFNSSCDIYGSHKEYYDKYGVQIVNPDRVEKICSILETNKDMKLKLREQIIEAIETVRDKFHGDSFNPEAFASAIVDAVIAGMYMSRIECIHEKIKNTLKSLLTDSNRVYRIFLLDKLKPVLTQLDRSFGNHQLIKDDIKNRLNDNPNKWITSYSKILVGITDQVEEITRMVDEAEKTIKELTALNWLSPLADDQLSGQPPIKQADDHLSGQSPIEQAVNLSSMCQTQIDKDRNKILFSLKQEYKTLNHNNDPAYSTINDFVEQAKNNNEKYHHQAYRFLYFNSRNYLGKSNQAIENVFNQYKQNEERRPLKP